MDQHEPSRAQLHKAHMACSANREARAARATRAGGRGGSGAHKRRRRFAPGNARRRLLREEREDQSFAEDLKERYPLALTSKWQKLNNKVRKRLSELREERDALPFSDVKGRDALDEERSKLAGAFVKEWDRALEQEARKEK